MKKNAILLLCALVAACVMSLILGYGWSFRELRSPPKLSLRELRSEPSLDVKELRIEDKILGNGPGARVGQHLEVRYTGWLYDRSHADHKGNPFDRSEENQTFRFKLGAKQVIAGWEQGLIGMKKGGVRQLVVPSKLGYGTSGAGEKIPPNAALLFEIELVRLTP